MTPPPCVGHAEIIAWPEQLPLLKLPPQDPDSTSGSCLSPVLVPGLRPPRSYLLAPDCLNVTPPSIKDINMTGAGQPSASRNKCPASWMTRSSSAATDADMGPQEEPRSKGPDTGNLTMAPPPPNVTSTAPYPTTRSSQVHECRKDFCVSEPGSSRTGPAQGSRRKLVSE